MARRFEWIDLPAKLKQLAEMHTYGIAKTEDIYEVYGILKDEGLVAVIRPDGYVGMVATLSSTEEAAAYLRDCLVTV